jgi:hypothetical protein
MEALPDVLRGYVLEPGQVAVGELFRDMQLMDGSWAHRGTLVLSGQPVLIQVG